MIKLLSALTYFGASILTDLLRAFVFATVWLWFLVPLGLPVIGVIHAFGLIMVKALLFPGVINKDPDVVDSIINSVIVSLSVLGIGYLIHLCM